MVTSRAILVSALLACAGGVCRAQDSISATPGLPGDAVGAYSTTEQVNDYVVDLVEKTSSWGNKFRLGPIVKSSLSSTSQNFNHLIASQAASASLSTPGALPRASYLQWSVAGRGVNVTRNSATTTIPSAGIRGVTLGSAMLEFAWGPDGVWGTADDENNIVTALVSLCPRYTDRVYVSRIVAACNKASASNANCVLGLGGVDHLGNTHLLADGGGLNGPSNLADKKLIRVNTGARNAAAVNTLNSTAGTDSTATTYFTGTLVAQTTPTMIPPGLTGGLTRPVLVSTDLANNSKFEGVAGVLTSTAAHLPAGCIARGAASFVPQVFAPLGSGTRVGTCAVLCKSPSSGKTRAIAVWSVGPTGLPIGATFVEMPTTNGAIVDASDGFDPSNAFGSLGNQEFGHYGSQMTARGGNGPVALCVLPDGDLLVAATVTATGGAGAIPAGMDNYIACCRIDSVTQSTTWFIAAHTGSAAGSMGGAKAIIGDNGLDGRPGTADAGENDGTLDTTPIGTLAVAKETDAVYSVGPSLSAPAIDRMGNLYCFAHAAVNQTAGAPKRTLALIKSNLDATTNTCRLEKILELNDVLPSVGTTKNYQVQFLSIADNDSADSGSIWSSSVVNQPLAGLDPTTLPTGSNLALGGLVFRAKIVYDVNGDNQFIDPSLQGNIGTDEAYNVQMLLLPRVNVADIGRQGGLTGPDGQWDNNDFVVFINAFFGGDLTLADIGAQGGIALQDGQLDNNDFVVFINRFFSQQ